MYMIEIVLLNQSKLSLLGVKRQIPLHAQFRVICLITSTIFLLLQHFFIDQQTLLWGEMGTQDQALEYVLQICQAKCPMSLASRQGLNRRPGCK